MPIDEKRSAVGLDVFSLNVDGGRVYVERTGSTRNVDASFRYANGAFEMLVLLDVELEEGVALVDYSASLDRVVVFNIHRRGERLAEAAELGEFMDSSVLSQIRTGIGSLLLSDNKRNAFMVSSYEDDEAGEKYVVTKLMPTGIAVNL